MNAPVKNSGGDVPGQAHRKTSFSPSSFNPEDLTVEGIFSTGARVKRFWGFEKLLMQQDAIDLSRFKDAAVLDSHRSGSIRDILGRVEGVRIENGKLIGKIKFSKEPEGRSAAAKVAEGTVRSFSVGYMVLDYEETRNSNGETEVVVTKWQPFEVSLVSVPADAKALIRSKESPMDEDDENTELATTTATRAKPRASLAQRISSKIAAVRKQLGNITDEESDELFEGVQSADEVATRALDFLANQSRTTPTNSNRSDRRISGGAEIRGAIVDELAVRLGAAEVEGASRPFANARSILEIGRTYFEAQGISTRSFDDRAMADMMISPSGYSVRGGMHTTSDFPSIFGDAANRALLNRFVGLSSPLKQLSTKRNARDFRPQSFISLVRHLVWKRYLNPAKSNPALLLKRKTASNLKPTPSALV